MAQTHQCIQSEKIKEIEKKTEGIDVILFRLNAQDKKLDDILEHAKYTNWKVATLLYWKNFLTGAWAILSMLVVPIILYVAKIFIDNQMR